MVTIIRLSIKKIIRNNPVIVIFLSIFYLYLLYLSIFLNDFSAGITSLVLILPYFALIATGGIIKDEVSSGYLDFIVYKISRDKIVLGKFLGLSFLVVMYELLIIVTILSSYIILGGEYINLSLIFTKGEICFLLSVYLISLGIFLSCYLKGLMNFVTVLFIEIFVAFFLDFINLLDLLETGALTLKQSVELSALSLLLPQLLISRNNQIFFLLLFVYTAVFVFLTVCKFRKMELKRGL